MPLPPVADTAKQPLDIPSESPEPPKVARASEGGEGAGGAGEEAWDERAPEAESLGMCHNPRLQRYLVAVEYIGTRFSGSQKQPNRRTVTGTLEEAFLKFVGQPVSAVCSSRTDAGVHALSNVFHVDVQRISKRKPNEVLTPHEPGVVRRAINHFLQKEGDIMVNDVQCVPEDFHARFKALERTYFYRLLCGPELLPVFERERAWHVPEELDISAMKKACNSLVGLHDFSSFRAAGCQATSPVKTLDELSVCEVAPFIWFPSSTERKEFNAKSLDGDSRIPHIPEKCSRLFGERHRHRCFVITARACSFLYHQVRLLVGVLKCVGTGELTSNDVERILNAKTVIAASPMAPACGLYLCNIKYCLP
ncbi:tRNA pseudouridine38-40 synthase [Apostasia shenzhenica]|uniref:tRNA pseudouridine synthase n=1 Tax=Apostasia shenzhenica TaxID=1088818 RepID=A0A2I0BB93_9ASPA|nr:tRNA pseudouridine38-40 synthase [Apostasia shenzhenica]